MDPNLLTTVAMFAVFIMVAYFVFIRPQKKRQAEQQDMISKLAPGARVLTSTGIYATLIAMGERQALIELAPGQTMTVVKHAIVRVVTPDDEDALGGADMESDGEFDEGVSEGSTEQAPGDFAEQADDRQNEDDFFGRPYQRPGSAADSTFEDDSTTNGSTTDGVSHGRRSGE